MTKLQVHKLFVYTSLFFTRNIMHYPTIPYTETLIIEGYTKRFLIHFFDAPVEYETKTRTTTLVRVVSLRVLIVIIVITSVLKVLLYNCG